MGVAREAKPLAPWDRQAVRGLWVVPTEPLAETTPNGEQSRGRTRLFPADLVEIGHSFVEVGKLLGGSACRQRPGVNEFEVAGKLVEAPRQTGVCFGSKSGFHTHWYGVYATRFRGVNTNWYGWDVEGQRRSREDWIAAGLKRLGEVGVDKVRVDQIASVLDVTKGSFYWHFKDRSHFLDALVETWEAGRSGDPTDAWRSEGLDPEARSQHLWKLISGSDDTRAEMAIRDWARRNDAVAKRVQRVDDRRLHYLEAIFTDLGMPATEVGPRSLLAYSLLIGDYLVTTRHAKRAQRRIMVADALLLVINHK
jgi:AcrR family transcriptional regulator